MQYTSRYRSGRQRRSRSMNYLSPFLILISIGVILVLAFQLWKVIFSEEAEGGVFMHFEQGSAQMKTWGTDDFFEIRSDVRLIQGDEIRTSADAQVIFEFFDGTLMRADAGTELVFEVIDEDKDQPKIVVLLVDGQLWFNKIYNDTGTTDVQVTMSHVMVHSAERSIFAVENTFDEAVRVIAGEQVTVDVLSDDEKVVDTEVVGVGQEIVFTDKALERYWQFQSPSILAALSDEFKASAWYLWNTAQDKNPVQFVKTLDNGETDFVEVPPSQITPTDEPEDESEPEPEPEPEEIPTPSDSALPKPQITSVAGVTTPDAQGVYQVTARVATLKGSVSGAAKVVVNDYTLQQFTAGSTSWTYFANADFGLMKAGENIYTIYAVDAEGTKSQPLVIKVNYTPQKAAPAAPAPAPTPAATPAPAPTETTPAPSY